ncbi:MAG: transglycosylase domain-containing protein [Alphaproteobacteria bacterium]
MGAAEGLLSFLKPGDRPSLSSSEQTKRHKKKKANVTPGGGRPPKPSRGRHKKRTGWFFAKWGFICLIWGSVLAGGALLWFGYDLPDIQELQLMPRRPSITLLDQNGVVLATYGDLYGRPVPAEELPPHVIQAFLAIEDRRFYHHFGIDVLGLARAIWINYRAGATVQGGSTITQQLAKNFLFSKKLYGQQDRTLRRKIQEAILALWLERRFTKNQILTMYLNRVYFGSGTYGIDGASERYFLRSAKDLSLYEAAVLAGLLKAPSRYSPAQNAALSEGRATQVLQSMVEAGFISKQAMEAALVLATPPPETPGGSSVRYFTDWVVDTLPHWVDIQDRDVEVVTTLDGRLQQLAEQKAQEAMEGVGKKWKTGQMALVSMTPEGAIKAMLGGLCYQKTKYNRVTQALRQPGSAFKFFVFLEALNKGWTPDTLIDDSPIRIGKWSPSNYLHRTKGEITFREAFAKSVNAVSVRLAMAVGVNAIRDTAQRLGITSKLPSNLTISLGSGEVTLLELTGAFATVARLGLQVRPHGILQVKDKQTGRILYQWKETPAPLFSKGVAQQMTDIMQAVLQGGTGRSATLPRPAAGKTGTSQAYKDLWLIGFTPELVTGVWSGIDSAKPMTYTRGGGPSNYLWKAFMEQALKDSPIQFFEPFSGTEEGFTHEGQPPQGGVLDELIEDAPPPDDLPSGEEETQKSGGLLDSLFRDVKEE